LKKKNKIPLLNFETFINDDLLLKGEKLFDESKLEGLSENKAGEWTANVKDKKDFFCKVHVFREQIENYECICDNWTKNEMPCEHIVCLLFGVRNADSQAEVQKKTVVRRQRRSKSSITLNTLFELVKKEDLASFILTYSTKDKKFNLLLKTHFARKISEKSGEGIYRQILDEAFPAISEKTGSQRSKNLQLLSAVSKEMLIHNKDVISLEQFTDSFYILSALSNKLAYAMHVSEKVPAGIEELNIRTHKAFTTLFNPTIAPGLRHEINESLLDTISKTFYNYLDSDNFYELLFKNKLEDEQLERYFSTIREKIQVASSLSIKVKLLSYYVKAHESSKLKNKEDAWLNSQLSDPFLLLETFNNTLNKGYISAAENLLKGLVEDEAIEDFNYLKLSLKLELAKENCIKSPAHISVPSESKSATGGSGTPPVQAPRHDAELYSFLITFPG